MCPDPSHELSVLAEKFRALQTLVAFERDIEKLQVYKRELDLVAAELREAEMGFDKKSAKVIPFAPKKPPRSA